MKFRKKIILLLAALMAAASLCGCGASGQKETETEEALPELTIGVDILEPFFYMDENGEYTGIDAKIAREACRRAGYEPVFTEIPWSERNSYLEDESVACLWTAFVMDGREEEYLWTEPYLESNLAILVDANAPDKSLETFRGMGGVAVRAGALVENIFLKEYPDIRIYSCGTFAMAKAAFIKGYANGLAGHKIVLEELMEEFPGMYRYLDENLKTTHLAVAFKKDSDEEPCRKIDEALEAMKQDGALDAIKEEYHLISDEEETADEND